MSVCASVCLDEVHHLYPSVKISGVDTDELDSNVEDWEEETIEFFISEDIIPFGEL